MCILTNDRPVHKYNKTNYHDFLPELSPCEGDIVAYVKREKKNDLLIFKHSMDYSFQIKLYQVIKSYKVQFTTILL